MSVFELPVDSFDFISARKETIWQMLLTIPHSFVLGDPSSYTLLIPPLTIVCDGCYHGDSPCRQIGGSLRAAEIHWVHIKEGTDDELLVVGVFFDVSEYGTNVEVSVVIALPPSYPGMICSRMYVIPQCQDGA